MKHILASLLLASLCASAGETPRTWTNADGKTITATLVAKTDTTCEVIVKDHKVTLTLASLSKADQDYVAAANLDPKPVISVHTVAEKVAKMGNRDESRTAEIEISKTSGKPYAVYIVWLVSGPSIAAQDHKAMTGDGKVVFQHTFLGPRNYVGYAVGLAGKDENGSLQWLASSGSQPPYTKYLGMIPPPAGKPIDPSGRNP